MSMKEALNCLKSKIILGEYGPTTRPFVVLDVDEYNLIVKEIELSIQKRKVPRETSRKEYQTV